MFKSKVFIFLSLMSFAMVSCTPDADEILEATSLPMKGTQSVPTNTSTGTGIINAKFNKSTGILDYTVTWNALTGPVVGMHFHKAARGSNGPVVKNIQSSGSATGSVTQSWTVPDSLQTTLEQGGLYVNIHTVGYPDGEVRGQVEF